MSREYDRWLNEVQDALRSINISIDDWQSIWPFDFRGEHNRGTTPNDAAAKANRFWWQRQNTSVGRDCSKLPGCWLPRGHEGECQPQFEPGDYIKVEFESENGMPGEWMWVIVQNRDDNERIVYGRLDNESLNDVSGRLNIGSQLAISYDKVREHRKPSEFTTQ